MAITFIETGPNIWYISANEHDLTDGPFVSLAEAVSYAVEKYATEEYEVDFWGDYSGA